MLHSLCLCLSLVCADVELSPEQEQFLEKLQPMTMYYGGEKVVIDVVPPHKDDHLVFLEKSHLELDGKAFSEEREQQHEFILVEHEQKTWLLDLGEHSKLQQYARSEEIPFLTVEEQKITVWIPLLTLFAGMFALGKVRRMMPDAEGVAWVIPLVIGIGMGSMCYLDGQSIRSDAFPIALGSVMTIPMYAGQIIGCLFFRQK